MECENTKNIRKRQNGPKKLLRLEILPFQLLTVHSFIYYYQIIIGPSVKSYKWASTFIFFLSS